MGDRVEGQVVRLEAALEALRKEFLGWQCRLRQLSVREEEGRPSQGMRPSAQLTPAGEELGPITVLIVKAEPETVTAEFRHIVRRTQDPRERYKQAIRLLSAHYYQYPEDFSDAPTALFGPGADLADRILAAEACDLSFEQFSQGFHLPCRVRELGESEPVYQATFWHNAMFNPNIPGGARVLSFQPDWSRAEASR